MPEGPAGAGASPQAAATLPRRIGRYDVMGRLATGGMAEILLGRLAGPAGFERPVVIKRILPHLARQEMFVEMFLDEARIGAEVRHPNVTQTLELGREGDELYLVLEYLEGESAAGLMRRIVARNEVLDFGHPAYIVAEAAAGLQAAHEAKDAAGDPRGLVHRDVSPQNVFVTYSGQVKVLDFGIAKAAGRLSHTEVGLVKGKSSYMSPEQCLGQDLDPRSDIFSLGIVLYELTTSRRLFRRASELMILKAVTEEPIARPSQVIPGYPRSLEAIVLKALAQPREQRYQSAADMRRDLLAALRELRVDDDPAEALKALMHHLFPERIAEKQQMLRRVQAGSEITQVPASEIDQSFELESAVVRVVSRLTSTSRALPLAGLVALLAAVLALVVGVVWWRGGASISRSPSVVVPPVAATGASASQPAVVAPASLPAEVLVRVETTPPGALLTVDGVARGRSPTEVRLPRSSRPTTFELAREGHVTVRESVIPDVDHRLRVSLLKAPKAAKRRGPRPSPPPAKGFTRFD